MLGASGGWCRKRRAARRDGAGAGAGATEAGGPCSRGRRAGEQAEEDGTVQQLGCAHVTARAWSGGQSEKLGSILLI